MQNQLLPPNSVKAFKSSMPRVAESRYHRLILGHTRLKDHLNKIMPLVVQSPNCTCGNDRETTEHFLLHCRNSFFERISMIDKIQRGFIKTNTPPYHRKINITSLIGYNTELKTEMRCIIKEAVAEFLQVTAPFTQI